MLCAVICSFPPIDNCQLWCAVPLLLLQTFQIRSNTEWEMNEWNTPTDWLTELVPTNCASECKCNCVFQARLRISVSFTQPFTFIQQCPRARVYLNWNKLTRLSWCLCVSFNFNFSYWLSQLIIYRYTEFVLLLLLKSSSDQKQLQMSLLLNEWANERANE